MRLPDGTRAYIHPSAARKSSTSASWSRRSPRAASQSAPSGRRPTSPRPARHPFGRRTPRQERIRSAVNAWPRRSTGYTADSDVDLLVEFDPDHVPCLLGIARMEREFLRLSRAEGWFLLTRRPQSPLLQYWGQGFSRARQMVPQCCRSTSFRTRFQLVLGNSGTCWWASRACHRAS